MAVNMHSFLLNFVNKTIHYDESDSYNDPVFDEPLMDCLCQYRSSK